jgi:hypothetical protein
MKKIMRYILRFLKNPFLKILFYFLLLLGIFAIAGAFVSDEGFFNYMKNIITDQGTVAFFFAGIMTISVSTLMKYSEIRLEESMKIIDDHHQIICRYKGHKIDKVRTRSVDFFDKDGMFMELHHTRRDKPIKNKIKDIYSSEYESMAREVKLFNDLGVLLLPTVNVYTNIQGECQVNILDTTDVKELPSFVIGNGTEFLKAHRYSQTTNNLTIRLDDITVNGTNVTLHTSRTYYYHMLLTNRCMDYKLDCDMSVREIYEFNSKVSYLHESKLSNQIGINGMIITKDGYLLVEKRDHKKTTWKNKFAQPISLALKASDLGLKTDTVMGSTVEYANQKLLGVIKKTMRDNFGLLEKDYEVLDLSKNFLGMARDLLEGGKPNLYFVVTVNYNKDEFVELLKTNAATVRVAEGEEQKIPPLKTGKLSSKYYLIDYDSVLVSFDYGLKVHKNNVVKVPRIVYPRCTKFQQFKDEFGYKLSSIFNKYLEYDCGEALLVTLSYLELCQPRIEAIKNKDIETEVTK